MLCIFPTELKARKEMENGKRTEAFTGLVLEYLARVDTGETRKVN
jgi:hypothetical protein